MQTARRRAAWTSAFVHVRVLGSLRATLLSHLDVLQSCAGDSNATAATAAHISIARDAGCPSPRQACLQARSFATIGTGADVACRRGNFPCDANRPRHIHRNQNKVRQPCTRVLIVPGGSIHRPASSSCSMTVPSLTIERPRRPQCIPKRH